jgi:hypothetical protein
MSPGNPDERPAAAAPAGSNPATALEKIYAQLSEEQTQDQRVADSSGLLFDEINADKLRNREGEYTDVEKHWVRQKAWLSVARQLAPAAIEKYGRGLRYFTLPGVNRLDVGLLQKENLLAADVGNPGCIYVAGFEADPTKFGRMTSRSPKFKLFGNCSVESALTDLSNEYYTELLQTFPFDIVNLDLTTSLTPQHEGPYSKTMKAIEAVLKRQAEYPLDWALFLTFRNLATDWEVGALGQLKKNLQENLAQYPAVRDAFYSRHQQHDVDGLTAVDVECCISQCVVKWLVDRAHNLSMQLKSYKCFQYRRYPKGLPPYTISKQILVLSRGAVSEAQVPTKNTPREAWMADDLVTCIKHHKPLDVESKLYEISVQQPQIFADIENEIRELCKIHEG